MKPWMTRIKKWRKTAKIERKLAKISVFLTKIARNWAFWAQVYTDLTNRKNG